MLRGLTLTVVAVLCAGLANACECENPTPIQKGRYDGRAVFSARVVRMTGEVYDFGGKRASDKVRAVVQRRYWGIPADWPTVVTLDGSYPCDIAMIEGEEYLVSGNRTAFGTVSVRGCSRTQPLATAQVDLRTLDGSHCGAPGGTLIGRVYYRGGNPQKVSVLRDTVLTLQDSAGKTFSAKSDTEGIYELRHIPAGRYTLASRLDRDRYAVGRGHVTTGVCTESTVDVSPYKLTGRLSPDLAQFARIELIGTREGTRGEVAPDGRFYFQAVPPGEYYLVVTVQFWGPSKTKVYYPGVRTQERATLVRVSDRPPRESFDFNPEALPTKPSSPVPHSQ